MITRIARNASSVPFRSPIALANQPVATVSLAHEQKLVAALLLITAVGSTAFAQTKVELQPGDTMRSVLERQVGQPIELRMHSGEKLGGKLEKVTEELAHLSQLTGAEFYDAVVDIKEVAAVSVRTKAK